MSWSGSRGARRLAGAALLAAALAGCGYHVYGVGGQLPGGATQVAVPIFENRTTNKEIAKLLTEAFIRELLAAGKLRVAQDEQTQAEIRGTVTTYRVDPITFDTAQKPLENRLTVVMDLALFPKGAKQALWAERGVVSRTDYRVATDLQQNVKLEEAAMRDLSHEMSQKLVGLMMEGF